MSQFPPDEIPTQPDNEALEAFPLDHADDIDLGPATHAQGNVGPVNYVSGPLAGQTKGKKKSNLRIPLGEQEKPKSKAERVQFIVELMAENRWVTGVTGPKLAYMWNLSEASLKADAAEASRFFLTTNEDREELKKRWRAKLESAQEQAATKGRIEALASLLKLEGDNLGVFEAQKVDVSITGSDEELAARVAALVAAGTEASVPGQPE